MIVVGEVTGLLAPTDDKVRPLTWLGTLGVMKAYPQSAIASYIGGSASNWMRSPNMSA